MKWKKEREIVKNSSFLEENPGETRVFRDPGNLITALSKYERNVKADCDLGALVEQKR